MFVHTESFALIQLDQAFVLHLSKSLDQEVRRKNVLVYCLTPGVVSTNMTRNMDSNILIPNARMYVESALNDIRFRWNGNHSTGYVAHEFLRWVMAFIQFFLGETLALEIMGFITVRMEKLYFKLTGDPKYA